MKFPAPAHELALHERVLAGDPIAPVDAFEEFMEPLVAALQHDLPCTEDEGYDSAIDALLAYLENSPKYDRDRGRLSSYLIDIAKKKAIDRLRSHTASTRREGEYATGVALQAANPKEKLGIEIEARQLWQKVEEEIPSESDRQALKLILSGERSPEVLAEALQLSNLQPGERRRRVKQHRDRLLKMLKTLGKGLADDNYA